MDIVVSGRNAEIHPNFRSTVESKLEKVTQFYPRAQRVDVVVKHEGNPRLADRAERIELTVYGKGPVIRAEAESSDRYAALDIASGKLFARLRKVRDKAKDHKRVRIEAPWPGEPAPDVVAEGLSEDMRDAEDWKLRSAQDLQPGEMLEEQVGDSPVVVRQKVHEAVPMSVDEAIYQMEMVGHPFFLFIDEDTMQPCVAYHRTGWTYGVFRLNTKVELAQE